MRWQVFDVDNLAVGEFQESAAVTWTLGGSPTVTPGGSVKMTIPNDVSEKSWAQIGNLLVTRPHPDLPLWAGVIDTPWEATLPVSVTAYSIEYLMSLRAADSELLTSGSVEVILRKMIDLANAQQDLYFRIGNVNQIDATTRQETIRQTNLWEQFQSFAKRTATEFVMRPSVEGGRLVTYVDIASTQGEYTNMLLYDGDGGNANINGATVDGQIWNRVIGVGAQSTSQSRLQTAALLDETSAARQRLRSSVSQFDVKTPANLLANAKSFLEAFRHPYIKFSVKVFNSNGIFRSLRLGNSFFLRASAVRLPGGILAWSGITRIMSMTYSEAEQSVSMTLIGAYND